MGILKVTIAVGDSQGRQFEELDVTVDTGSTYTAVVPRQLYLPVGVNQFCRFTSLAWPRCWAALVR